MPSPPFEHDVLCACVRRDTSREAQIRNRFYLLYEIQKYIVIEEGRKHNPHAARQYKHQVMQMVKDHPPLRRWVL